MTKAILETYDIWDTDNNSDNWEPEFMTIFATWQLRVTLDSIRNSCDVYEILLQLKKKTTPRFAIDNISISQNLSSSKSLQRQISLQTRMTT